MIGLIEVYEFEKKNNCRRKILVVFGRLRSETPHAADVTVHIDVPVLVAVRVRQPRQYAVGHNVRVFQPPDQAVEQTEAHVTPGIQNARQPDGQLVQGQAQVLRSDVDDVLHERSGGERGRRRAQIARRPAGSVSGPALRQRHSHIEVVGRPSDRAQRAQRQSDIQRRVHVGVQRHVPVAVQLGNARRSAGRVLLCQKGHLARQRGQGAVETVRFADEHHFPRERIRQQLWKGKIRFSRIPAENIVYKTK